MNGGLGERGDGKWGGVMVLRCDSIGSGCECWVLGAREKCSMLRAGARCCGGARHDIVTAVAKLRGGGHRRYSPSVRPMIASYGVASWTMAVARRTAAECWFSDRRHAALPIATSRADGRAHPRRRAEIA